MTKPKRRADADHMSPYKPIQMNAHARQARNRKTGTISGKHIAMTRMPVHGMRTSRE